MSDKQETDGAEVYQTESRTFPAETTKPSKKRTCLQHLKRFWWAYLLVLICIVVLVVCLVIFVGVPKIAQSKVNDAVLEVQGVNVLNSKPNSITLEINSTITTDGSIKADIDSFDGVMYLEDLPDHIPFVNISFPATNGDKHQQINISQEVQIQNPDPFNTFNIWFAANETLRVTIEGQTKVKPSGLSRKFGVTFKKTITMNGLNLFNGTTVTNGKIDIAAKKGQPNFHATADIPNASYFTLDIGNTTFTNFIDDTNIGSLTIQNLFLVPGSNKVPVSAILDQAKVLTAVQSAKYCKTGIIPVKLQGSAVRNDDETLQYFLDGLSANNETVPMDIGSIIKDSLGASVGCASSN
ncbi:hypothetical protein TARUN_6960 [Trichoderma arundinaceum]|uniref:Uncharacterized protein n=1 Tax=Trichoderma arundinaceum TaxID=490622 RepID=A0A395NGP7_TRIAR|nr:hypothetical protein TARUN_6960 [Trichoderma arundinaceum]